VTVSSIFCFLRT